jgi:hypothetical protein
VSAELSARRTAAAAVLGDYLREAGTADSVGLALWAGRLGNMLGELLAALEFGSDQEAAQLGEVRRVLAAFDWETDDRQYALERIDGIVNGGRS